MGPAKERTPRSIDGLESECVEVDRVGTGRSPRSMGPVGEYVTVTLESLVDAFVRTSPLWCRRSSCRWEGRHRPTPAVHDDLVQRPSSSTAQTGCGAPTSPSTPTADGKVYLAAVEDLFTPPDRRVVHRRAHAGRTPWDAG
jgi:hypothetical protein